MSEIKLKLLNSGNFKLDGGAVFGVVPKVLWNKVYPADENNMCPMTLRVMLIDTGNRKILVDTGIGEKQNEKFLSYYYLSETKPLEKLLAEQSVSTDDITDVILTHLHFDHCGGAVFKDETTQDLKPRFRNATYWVSQQQWDWAIHPNQREKASFLKENMLPLQEENQLQLIQENTKITPEVELRIYNGHTVGQIIPFVQYHGKTFVYTGDLIPTSAHIPASYVCGYDIQPLVSMEERAKFLEEACDKNYILTFEHDFYNECCDLMRTEKGIRQKSSLAFQDLL